VHSKRKAPIPKRLGWRYRCSVKDMSMTKHIAMLSTSLCLTKCTWLQGRREEIVAELLPCEINIHTIQQAIPMAVLLHATDRNVEIE